MKNHEIVSIFNLLIDKFDEILHDLKQQEAKHFSEENYDESKYLQSRINGVSKINNKILAIKREWYDLGLYQIYDNNSENRDQNKLKEKPEELSEQELEILRYLQSGMPNEEISQKLDLAVGTTRNYISKLLSTLEVSNRTEAVKKAISKGYLLPVDPNLKAIEKINHQYPAEAIKTHFDLSQREIEVLSLAENGFTNKVIAEKMELGEGTIRNYLSSCYKKLSAKNRIEAIKKAKHYGLI